MKKLTKYARPVFSVGALPLYLVSLMLSPVPAHGQGVFDMGVLTNTLSMSAVGQSETERAKKVRGAVRHSVRPSKATRGVSVRPNFGTFKPSATARKRNISAFLDQLRLTDPVNAAAFQKVFATQDVFGLVSREMRKYGLKTTNLADSMTIYLVTAWQYSKSGRGEPTKAQYLGVREQMALALGQTRAISAVSDSEKQKMSDSFLLQALLIDAYAKATKPHPAALPKLRSAIAQSARTSFGFDMNTLKLTSKGFKS